MLELGIPCPPRGSPIVWRLCFGQSAKCPYRVPNHRHHAANCAKVGTYILCSSITNLLASCQLPFLSWVRRTSHSLVAVRSLSEYPHVQNGPDQPPEAKDFYTACAHVGILRNGDSIRHCRLTSTAGVVPCVVEFIMQRCINCELWMPRFVTEERPY